MADNYLEKKMEQHASLIKTTAGKTKSNLMSLLEKNRSTRDYDNSFTVRTDQLQRIVAVNTRVASARNAQPLRFRIVTHDEAHNVLPYIKMGAALTQTKLPQEGKEPNAFIVVCSIKEARTSTYIDLGISAQSMLLQATEIGLNGVCIMSLDKEKITKELSLPYETLLIVAIGKSAEKIQIVDISAEEGHDYYRRDNIHYVPKLTLDELIID